jgi:prophage maintenance system killer protein
LPSRPCRNKQKAVALFLCRGFKILCKMRKDEGFTGILNSIVQTFDRQYLYPSIEEQAGHLLYFIIKNHPFTDGNKRIGVFLFVWFLDKHRSKKMVR